jgi:hypothetical protein
MYAFGSQPISNFNIAPRVNVAFANLGLLGHCQFEGWCGISALKACFRAQPVARLRLGHWIMCVSVTMDEARIFRHGLCKAPGVFRQLLLHFT